MPEAGKQERVRYEFEVPKGIPTDVKTVTLVELNPEEEMMAASRARGDVGRLPYEYAKQALVKLDDNVVGAEDGSIDAAWSKMHPKLRGLIVNAYVQLHAPADAQLDVFLKSRRAVV